MVRKSGGEAVATAAASPLLESRAGTVEYLGTVEKYWYLGIVGEGY